MSYINIYTVHISYIRSFLFYIFSVSISVAPVVPVGDCNGFGFPKTFTSKVVVWFQRYRNFSLLDTHQNIQVMVHFLRVKKKSVKY